MIIYTGRFDPEFLELARILGVAASQPPRDPNVQLHLKRAAAIAKLDYRKTCILRRRLDRGELEDRDLDAWERWAAAAAH